MGHLAKAIAPPFTVDHVRHALQHSGAAYALTGHVLVLQRRLQTLRERIALFNAWVPRTRRWLAATHRTLHGPPGPYPDERKAQAKEFHRTRRVYLRSRGDLRAAQDEVRFLRRALRELTNGRKRVW